MQFRYHRLPRGLFVFVTVLLLGALPVAPALAAETAKEVAFPEKFMLRLSSYNVEQADTDILVGSTDSGIRVGTGINFADDLGGDDAVSIPRIDLYYRFNERHRIEFSSFQIERSGRRIIDIEIDIEDKDFNIGETIISEFTTTATRLGYAYSFYHSPKVELSLSTGLNFYRYEFDVRNADGSTSNGNNVSAPLPMFGLRAGYALNDNWSIHYLSETFFIEIDNALKGALLNYELNVQYRFLERFVLGGGITRVSTDLQAKDEDWSGRINDSHRGIMFFASYYL